MFWGKNLKGAITQYSRSISLLSLAVEKNLCWGSPPEKKFAEKFGEKRLFLKKKFKREKKFKFFFGKKNPLFFFL